MRLLVLALLLYAAPVVDAKYDYLQFAFDQTKSANNTRERILTPDNVRGLRQLFKVPLDDVPDGAPVLLTDVATPSGMRDVVYVQGLRGKVSAFDARTGAPVWTRNFPGSGTSNASPAIDPNRQFVYANTNDSMLHKLRVGDGTEVIGEGWPQLAGPGKPGSSLTLSTSAAGKFLYASNHGHGHITTVNLDTGSQHVFSLACADRPDIHFGLPGGPTCDVRGPNPWSRGPSFDPVLGRLFQMGGSNDGRTWVPGEVWRQSWVALPPDGSTALRNGGGYPVDSYTPTDWEDSVRSDRDIGSGGLLILPKNISSRYPHLGVQPGKDRKIRLLNIADLSGKGGPGHLGGELQLFDFPEMSMMRSQGAVWTAPDGAVWVFVPGEKGLAAFQVVGEEPGLVLKWTLWSTWTTSVLVANGVLYAANGGGEKTHTFKSRELQAINPVSGQVLWSGTIGEHHWSSPIVANGVVYVVDGNSGGFGTGKDGHLIAWGL